MIENTETHCKMNFTEWLERVDACEEALVWVRAQPDQSIPALLATCPNGEWILWCYERAGYDFETLAPVAYRAANRALGYAADALDRGGIRHDLRRHVITDRESARAAAGAAALAAAGSARAARAARAAELKRSADDCRELLPPLEIEGVE